MPRQVIKIDWVKRSFLRMNPDKIFLYGSNLAGYGLGGQAKECRGEPNSLGIPTKKLPTMEDEAFFTDEEYEINKSFIDIAFSLIPDNVTVFVPSLGTGLAKLPEKAPKTYQYLLSKIAAL